MSVRSGLIIFAVFAAAVLILFPYDSVARYKLAAFEPALQYENVTASPWSGVRMSGVRYTLAGDFVLNIDEVRMIPAGLFPLKLKISLTRGSGKMDVILSGSADSLTILATATGAEVTEWIPALGSDVRLQVEARASCVMGLRPLSLADGSTIVFERISGDIPATSSWAQAGERMLGMTGWASVWGSKLREGRVAMEASGGALVIKTIHLKTEGLFAGSGEIRPVFPLSEARVRLQGQATLSGRTIPIDNTISLGSMFGGPPS